jgi:histidyl-tRNA synthetase
MQALPGFRDFLPSDCVARNYIFAKWREVARRYGFVEWDGPVLEPTELYKKKSGDEIVGQLFNFTDKGEREVALRPELTPTLARVIAAHEREFKKPLKWFSIGQFFRYEKQQRGRLREHYQLNCDIMGEESLNADVELIALCIDLLRSFGFTEKDFIVRISSRKAWADFLARRAVPGGELEGFLQIIDKLERTDSDVVEAKLNAIGLQIEDVVAFAGNPIEDPTMAAMIAEFHYRNLQEYVRIDLRIVRGLAYYTGIVFELFDRTGKFRAIAGGGRYDNLIEQLSDGAVVMPALGFAMGDVVLGELIGETASAREAMQKAIAAEQKIDIYIVIAKEERRANALAQIQKLRDHGYRVDYSLTAGRVARQFQTAEDLGATVALLYGDEWPQVKVKTLATREETVVPHDEIITRVANLL